MKLEPIDTQRASLRIISAMAFGDAFGAPYECLDNTITTAEPYMVENTRLGTAPGQWTDDTAMGIAMGRALLENKGAYVMHKAQEHYRFALTANTQPSEPPDWSSFGQLLRSVPPLGWGSTTREALMRGRGEHSNRAGAIMRVPVMAYATNIKTVDALASAVDLDTRITHAGEDAVLFGVAYAMLQRLLLLQSPRNGFWVENGRIAYDDATVLDDLFDILNYTFGRPSAIRVVGGLRHMMELPDVELCEASVWDGTACSVFFSAVVYAMRFRKLASKPGFFISAFSMCQQACKMGGDTDTRCAIMLPLCWEAGSIPRNYAGHDYIGALDLALTAYLYRSAYA